MLRIAVLGCGRIGRMHAENVAAHPLTCLAGVYDIHRPSAEAVARRLGGQLYESADAVFASEGVDAVLIASSTDTHAGLIEAAVAAGKPALCEKPIDLDLARVNRCAEAILGRDVPVMLGFVRRFDPGHRAVREAVRAGEIGDLYQVAITSRDPSPPPASYAEVSGGIFRDMTIHDFDMARFVLGEEPVTVYAVGSRLIDPPLMARLGDHDVVTVVLTTALGKQCLITNSRQAPYGYDQRVEALGSLGMAVSENRHRHGARLSTGTFTDRAAPYLDFFIERYAQAFMAEIGAFAEAVSSGRAPEVGFEDGRRALLLAEAALRSVAQGRAVNLSEIG